MLLPCLNMDSDIGLVETEFGIILIRKLHLNETTIQIDMILCQKMNWHSNDN